MIELSHLRAGYPGREVLHDITLNFPDGAVSVLLGPNGCGKSTLLRTIPRLLPCQQGSILLDGQLVEQLTQRQIAQQVAYLPQSRNVPNITALRMVLHGRFPYLKYPRRYRQQDWQIARQALEWVGATELSERALPQLSGGQRQKVYLAMALAQDTRHILMDEPTTYLDISSQLEVMELARRLAGQGRAVVLVLHDLCLAMQYGDRIFLLSEGVLRERGTPEKVYVSGALDALMGVHLCRVETERGWRYYCERL